MWIFLEFSVSPPVVKRRVNDTSMDRRYNVDAEGDHGYSEHSRTISNSKQSWRYHIICMLQSFPKMMILCFSITRLQISDLCFQNQIPDSFNLVGRYLHDYLELERVLECSEQPWSPSTSTLYRRSIDVSLTRRLTAGGETEFSSEIQFFGTCQGFQIGQHRTSGPAKFTETLVSGRVSS